MKLRRTLLMKRIAILVFLVFGVLLGAAWSRTRTESVLYSFCSQANCTDGVWPYSSLIFDQKGNVYGTTFTGGVYHEGCYFLGCGIVFKVTPEGKETVLYTFCAQTNCADGAEPFSGLIFDEKGNLYGTTSQGGVSGGCGCCGCGVVFKLTPKGKYTVLHTFCGEANCADGKYPHAALVFDRKGNLYGTTVAGGSSGCADNGCGVVFKLTSKGKYAVLHTFCEQGGKCSDGVNPHAGLVLDQRGNLYGTTSGGGSEFSGAGVVFKITPESKETVLYSFCSQSNCADGEDPQTGLVFDGKGNLYGTTLYGGAYDYCGEFGIGCGVVFKLTPKGKETVLYSFCAQGGYCADGAEPYGGLIFDQKGNLYGTAITGGAHNGNYNCYVDSVFGCGVLFKLTPKGKYAALYNFCAQSGCADGAEPYGGLVFDREGNLYGTTVEGGSGSDNSGVVFKLTP